MKVQREERSPQVWCAVLGCLLHLVTHCGYVVRAYLQGLSLRVLAALMHCCLHHHWCHTIYCQLVRLAVNMMYVPASPDLDSGELHTLLMSSTNRLDALHWSLTCGATVFLKGRTMLV